MNGDYGILKVHIESTTAANASCCFFAFVITAGKVIISPPSPGGGSLGKNKGKNLWITIPYSGSVDHLNDENNHSK